MKQFSKRIFSILLVMVMLLSMLPMGAMAAPASDLPENMIDSPILRALEYTGYDVQKQKDNGTLYQSGHYGSSIPSDILSGINYGTSTSGKETVADSSTPTGLAPDIATFLDKGLCCASFVTYYFNYIINVEEFTPSNYLVSKGLRKPTRAPNPDPYKWSATTVNHLLSMQEYCGDVINFKTYSKSYKNKKRYQNDPENMVIFRDVNPAIWDRETFEKIQALSNGTRKRKGLDGEKNMFSGLLKCADCGKNLHFHFNQANHDIKYFNCPGYNQGKRKICQSTHYIRVDFLEQVVLSEIRRLTRFACQHEDVFTKAVAQYSKESMETDQRIRESELRALMARDKELDVLYEKIYEDNALGKISDDRFKKLAQKYEEEQSSIAERIGELKAKFDEASSKVANTDTFIAAVRKYTRIRKLTPRVLAELIDHIEVHQAQNVPGGQVQRIVIFYNCIGSIEIPEEVSIPLPQITMKTRQGVAVTYDPLPLATV